MTNAQPLRDTVTVGDALEWVITPDPIRDIAVPSIGIPAIFVTHWSPQEARVRVLLVDGRLRDVNIPWSELRPRNVEA